MAVCVIWSDCPEPIPLRTTLTSSIEKLIITKQADHFLVRNEGLFDAMVHFILVELKKKYPWITFNVVLPNYPITPLSKEELDEAYIPECITKGTISGKELRDRWMLSAADIILLYGNLNVKIHEGINVVKIIE